MVEISRSALARLAAASGEAGSAVSDLTVPEIASASLPSGQLSRPVVTATTSSSGSTMITWHLYPDVMKTCLSGCAQNWLAAVAIAVEERRVTKDAVNCQVIMIVRS